MGDELRWVLLILGIFFITGVYFYSKWQMNRKNQISNLDENKREPNLLHSKAKQTPNEEHKQKDHVSQPKEPIDLPKIPNVDKIIVLYIQCKAHKKISGNKLFQVAKRAGLKFNIKDQLFHRLLEADSKTPRIFSMANMHDPGVFNEKNIDHLLITGVSLFMTLPGPVSALDGFDAMLASAQRLSEHMEADILDDSFCVLTRQRILYLRDEMRDFERQRQGL